ncbi:IS630 family transposase [Anoxybacillus rupiensis]|nr:IS630 family transposase [Anoxybacillus rupiensis]
MMTDCCVLLYEDESHIRDVQTLHATWQPKGKQKQMPVSESQTTLHLFGAVNPEEGEVFCMETDTCNTQTFHQFLKYLLPCHPQKHLILVLDHARYHHALALRPFLTKHEDRLTLFFLPSYSPTLNLMERIWKWLKEVVLSNRYDKDRADLRDGMKYMSVY